MLLAVKVQYNLKENHISRSLWHGDTVTPKETTNLLRTSPTNPITLSDDEQGGSFITSKTQGIRRFHETILSFGEPGSLGIIFSVNQSFNRPRHILQGKSSVANLGFRPEAAPHRRLAGAGRLILRVAEGKGCGSPLAKIMGLYSSGTLL